MPAVTFWQNKRLNPPKKPAFRIAPPVSSEGVVEAGVYRLSAKSGALYNYVANDCVFSMRWSDSDYLCQINKVEVKIQNIVGFTAAQLTDFGLYFARSFTAPDQLGKDETGAVLPGPMDSAFPPTNFVRGDIRIAGQNLPLPGQTGTVINAGTRTLDYQPMAYFASWNLAGTAGGSQSSSVERTLGVYAPNYPIVLRQNEGIVLNSLTALGAAGRVVIYVSVEWQEFDAAVN